MDFAEDYYEIALDRAAVEHVVNHGPLTGTVVQALNPGVTVKDLRDDGISIGYPVAGA